jgi:type I restriction enzyme, S subunit
MENWNKYKFSDFTDINPKTALVKEEEYSFVEMKDLDESKKFCSPSRKRVLTGGSRFKNGDTLFARITPCLENGKICQVRNLEKGKGFGSTEFLVFRSKKEISHQDFIYYLSRWDEVRDFAEVNMTGSSGRQRVAKEVFDNLRLTLPPLLEQKTIASALSSLDDKIDLLHRQNQTLEAMAETLFKEWFVVNAKEKWEEKALDEVANYLNGLACQKFPPKNEVSKLPVLKIKDLQSGISESSDWVSNDVPKAYLVQNGDIIFSWSASLLVKIWDGEDCILNQHLFKVTSEDYPKWFYYLWTKHYLDEFIAVAKSHATTMGHIKRSDLKQAMVKVPTAKEITEMDKHFTPQLDKIISNNKQIRTLTKLRDTLLPKLMSGEVRVNY